MRCLIIFLLFINTAVAQNRAEVMGKTYRMKFPALQSKQLPDGWYTATVEYTNFNTYTQSEYTLNVEVESEEVIRIDFGNGRYIHNGFNNSNYTYTGGNLDYDYNFTGDIIKATTEVTIYRGTSTYKYSITIE